MANRRTILCATYRPCRMTTAILLLIAIVVTASFRGLSGLEREDIPKVKPPNWKVLLIKFDDSRKLKKVKLVMYEQKDVTEWNSYLQRSERCEIETTDGLILGVMPEFLFMPYRHACPETPEYDNALRTRCVGEIQVTTTKDEFMIGITSGGFTLESKVGSYRNTFDSWGLATLVDRILKDHGKQGLSPQLFTKLSPEGWVEMEKHHLKTVEDMYKNRRDK